MPIDDITVLAVDDHASFRSALGELIVATPGFRLAGEAGTGEEAISAVEALHPQLLLMDVRMPGMGGPAAASEIRRRWPEVAIVLISADDPSLNLDAALTDVVVCLSKRDLRRSCLGEVWERCGR